MTMTEMGLEVRVGMDRLRVVEPELKERQRPASLPP